MLNKVVLIGRLTADPDVRVLQSGQSVSNFILAVQRDFKDRNGEKGTDFIPVVVWGHSAEYCRDYLNKGALADVSGRLQVRSYEKKDGSKAFVTEVVAESVHSLNSRQKQSEPKYESQSEPEQYGFEEVEEDWTYTDDGEMPF